jgi:tRNA-splicing endonuclease subunit Sen54
VSAFLAVALHEQFVLALHKCGSPLDVFYNCGRRNVASRARWVEEAGAAEVVESKGKLWLTTGVTRGGKLCYNVEEIGYATCSMKYRSCAE